MDYIFLSQVALVVLYVMITKFAYQNKVWEKEYISLFSLIIGKKILQVTCFIIWIIPVFVAIPMILLDVIIKGTTSMLSRTSYWWQVIICFGIITIWYIIVMYLDEASIKKQESQKIVEDLKREVKDLKQRLSKS